MLKVIIIGLLFLSGLSSVADDFSLKGLLGSNDTPGTEPPAFKRAIGPREFQFPRDHLPHPEYKTEWWYFTGNLATAVGERFGYQFTLFRVALISWQASNKKNLSSWRPSNIYMLHLALTDVNGEKIYHKQAMSRDSMGLAGVAYKDGYYQIWLDNWGLRSINQKQWLPLQLKVNEPEFAIDLQLNAVKPIILQGDKGLSQKSNQVGNASYYYSITRMPTQGSIRVGNKTYLVNGNSWFDREWSTSSLAANQKGWDWFALQLADGRDLMLYQLRLNDGSKDQTSYAIIVDEKGKQTQFNADQFEIQIHEYWQSPKTKIKYPISWQLSIPSLHLQLSVIPFLKHQEWIGNFKYWEGAVAVKGMQNEQLINGSGYLEMTGYDNE